MDLDFNEEQEMLRGMVREMLSEHCPVELVRKYEDDPKGFPPELWKQLGELGLTGMLLPEEYGGSNQTLLEAAVVYEEFGRAMAPTPHFVSAVMSGGVILAAGSEAQKNEWLPKIASGDAILTQAWIEPDNGFGPEGVQLQATPEGDGFRLDGVKRHVYYGGAADRIIVLARTGSGATDIDLFLVDPNAEGVKLTQQLSQASDAQYRMDLSSVKVSADDRIGAAGTGWATWDRQMLDGVILLAAEANGGADRALEITVAYANERKQFDKPLGAFQALSHYMADPSTNIDGSKVLTYEAAWTRAQGRPIERLAPMAKLFACETYHEGTRICEQIWGGVGFTIEYDIQMFFRRAKQLQLSWWDSRALEERVAASVLDD